MTDFVTIEGRTLSQAMRPVTAVIKRRNTIPILGHVRLTLDADGLSITVTDLDIEATASIDVIDGTGEWSTCIEASALAGIARAAGVAPITIRPQADSAVITVEDATYEVQTLPPSDFPEMTGSKRGKLIETFTNGMLASTLDKVRWCISTEETRYYLNGVAWQSRPDGCRFVATDGHRMALCHYSSEAREQSSRIIPRKTVGIISKHLAGKDVAIFATDKETAIEIAAPGLTIRAKLIDGTFPDVDRVIPREDALKHDFVFKRAEIISAIEKVAATGGHPGMAIRFQPNDDRVVIERKSPDFGNATVKTSTKWPSDTASPFAFNGRYAKEIVASCHGDITLRMSDSGSPFTFKDEDETMTRVLMPMRA